MKGFNFRDTPLLSCAVGGVKAAVSFLSSTELQCVTPQMPSGDAPLCVTLNGQPDPAGCAPTLFEAYPATLLRGITPVGGGGGTLVEVDSGFASGTWTAASRQAERRW